MTQKGEYTYAYPRPMVAADTAVFSVRDEGASILLIERKHDPYQGRWALPGGFVEMDEPLDAAAARELLEETGIEGSELVQIAAFGDPGRDPRGRCISVAHLTVVDAERQTPRAGDDAANARWFPLNDLPPLAFDHALILEYAVDKLRELLSDANAHDALFSEVARDVVARAIGRQ